MFLNRIESSSGHRFGTVFVRVDEAPSPLSRHSTIAVENRNTGWRRCLGGGVRGRPSILQMLPACPLADTFGENEHLGLTTDWVLEIRALFFVAYVAPWLADSLHA
jgi:hypothetical protein